MSECKHDHAECMPCGCCRCCSCGKLWNEEIYELIKSNERFRKALEFYADRENYAESGGLLKPARKNAWDIEWQEDFGEVAREALKDGL